MLEPCQHDNGKSHGDETHAKIPDHRGNGSGGNRQDEGHQRRCGEPEEGHAVNAVSFVEAVDECCRLLPVGVGFQGSDPEQSGTQEQGGDGSDQDIGTGLDEKGDEADARSITHDDIGYRADQCQQAADVGQQAFDEQKSQHHPVLPQLLQGNAGQGSHDDHGCHVVQHGREQHGHAAVVPQQLEGVATGCLGEPDGDPAEQPGTGGDIHEQAGADDDGDDFPVHGFDVDGHMQPLPAGNDDIAERHETEDGSQQQAADGKETDDERLPGMELLLQGQGQGKDHGGQDGGEQIGRSCRYGVMCAFHSQPSLQQQQGNLAQFHCQGIGHTVHGMLAFILGAEYQKVELQRLYLMPVFGNQFTKIHQGTYAQLRKTRFQHSGTGIEVVTGFFQQLIMQTFPCQVGIDDIDLGDGVHVVFEYRDVFHMGQVEISCGTAECHSMIDERIIDSLHVGNHHDFGSVLEGMVRLVTGLGMGQHHDRYVGTLQQHIEVFTQGMGKTPGAAVQVAIGTYQVRLVTGDQFEQVAGSVEFRSLDEEIVAVAGVTGLFDEGFHLVQVSPGIWTTEIGNQENAAQFHRVVGEDRLVGRTENAFKLVYLGQCC